MSSIQRDDRHDQYQVPKRQERYQRDTPSLPVIPPHKLGDNDYNNQRPNISNGNIAGPIDKV